MGNVISGQEFKEKALAEDLDSLGAYLEAQPDLVNWTDKVDSPL